MRLLLINGSPRKGGNTYLALKEAAQELERNGIETESVLLLTNNMFCQVKNLGMPKYMSLV